MSTEFKTAKEIEQTGLEDCTRCKRLGRKKPGKVPKSRIAFCDWCYASEMAIGNGEV